MTQTIKERLQLLKKEEREIAIDDGSGLYELGFNAGVDACLPLLEEVVREVRERFLNFIDEHDPNVKMGRKTNTAYWGNTLKEALTPLPNKD